MGCLNIEILIFIVYSLIAIEASRYDIKHRLVRNKTYISLCFLAGIQECVFLTNKRFHTVIYIEYFILISAVTFFLLLFAVITNGMGGGDIKYIFCNMLLFPKEHGAEMISYWFLIMFVLLLFYVLCNKRNVLQNNKGIAMLPFISLASVAIFILNLRS